MPFAATGQTKSLMLQLSKWPGDSKSLVDTMNYICQNHRDPGKPGHIQNLVIQDVAIPSSAVSLSNAGNVVPNDTVLTSLLAVLVPYFPLGSGMCQFDNVFVGTVDFETNVNVLNSNSWEKEFMTNAVRQNILTRSKKVASDVASFISKSSNSRVIYHWFINKKGILNHMRNTSVEKVYLDFLSKYIKDLASVIGPRAFVWSAGFDELPSAYPADSVDHAQLKFNLNDLFLRLRLAIINENTCGDTRYNRLWLNLLDHVGSTSHTIRPMHWLDAVKWYNFVQNTTDFASLGMNVEQFRVSNGSFFPGDPNEINARELFYTQHGIGLGAASEMKFWRAIQQ